MRAWRAEDREPFFALNREPVVQRYLSPLARSGSDAMLDRIDRHFAEHGWGFWALEERASGSLVGLCGIMHVAWDAPFGPAIELSWRLSTPWQGRGLAREAAEASIRYGFDSLGLDRIVAFAVPANAASWGLMERLGMRKIGTFDYPLLPQGHPLRAHVLYDITNRPDAHVRLGSAV